MAKADRAPIPAAPRKTLLEWIDHDDGDTTGTTRPACSDDLQALYAQLPLATDRFRAFVEPLQPPPGLALAPLG